MGVEKFRHDVCVVGGCGHVGLPLAITFAQKGFDVSIYDIDDSAIKQVREGQMPFLEPGAEAALRQVIGRSLVVDNDPGLVSRSRYVVVVIGTPVDEHLNPTFHAIRRFFTKLLPHLVDGQCIILRSTVYPGTTEKVRELVAGLGRDIHVAFCPERVAEGKAMEELVRAAADRLGLRRAEPSRWPSELFGQIARSIIRLSPLEAELTKIFANVWRYIQFATANQFFMIATDYGLDFYRIYEALTRDYPRMAGLPKSGFAAGPCLFKDTMQLAAASNNNFSLGHAAMLINEGLPNFLVRHAQGALPAGANARRPARHGVQGRERRPPRVAVVQAPQGARVRGRRGALHRRLHPGPLVPSLEEVARAIGAARSSAPRTASTASSSCRLRKPVVDIWNIFGKGSVPVVKILVTGSAGFIAGYLVEELLGGRARGRRARQLLEVRPRGARRTTPTPATAA